MVTVQFCCIFAATKDKFDYFLKKLFHSKAELLQLKLTPIICLMNFIDKKAGNRKN